MSSILKRVLNKKSATIRDHFETIQSLHEAFNASGIDSINVVFGIDFTGSNRLNGASTFGGKSLHYLDPNPTCLNFYERVISLLGMTLEKYDTDGKIPAFYFGDKQTKGISVGSLTPDGKPCTGFRGVLDAYRAILRRTEKPIIMDGPTSFAPIIRRTIEFCKNTAEYHLLVIICDGSISDSELKATKKAIRKASKYPMSICVIGVGDGPFKTMHFFDDDIKGRKFDNFQFVDANEFMSFMSYETASQEKFLINVLQEIPDQYAAIQRLKLYKNCKHITHPHTVNAYEAHGSAPKISAPGGFNRNILSPSDRAVSNRDGSPYESNESSASTSSATSPYTSRVNIHQTSSIHVSNMEYNDDSVRTGSSRIEASESLARYPVEYNGHGVPPPAYDTNGAVDGANQMSRDRELYLNQESRNLCVICQEREANAVFVPCGHFVCFGTNCHQHMLTTKKCHICNGPITNIIQTYR